LVRIPFLKAQEAERMLLKAGFELLRSRGSHRIYAFEKIKVVVPFHAGKELHPKVIKGILEAINKATNKEE